MDEYYKVKKWAAIVQEITLCDKDRQQYLPQGLNMREKFTFCLIYLFTPGVGINMLVINQKKRRR